jgi:hypothetical protein
VPESYELGIVVGHGGGIGGCSVLCAEKVCEGAVSELKTVREVCGEFSARKWVNECGVEAGRRWREGGGGGRRKRHKPVAVHRRGTALSAIHFYILFTQPKRLGNSVQYTKIIQFLLFQMSSRRQRRSFLRFSRK